MNSVQINKYSRIADQVRRQGLLTGIALDVYGIIVKNPGSTGGEIHEEYAKMYPNTDRARNEIAKRISDLAAYGAVKAVGETVCPTSGRKAARWQSTGQLPDVRGLNTRKTAKASQIDLVADRALQYRADAKKALADLEVAKQDNENLTSDNLQLVAEVGELKNINVGLGQQLSATQNAFSKAQNSNLDLAKRLDAAEEKLRKAGMSRFLIRQLIDRTNFLLKFRFFMTKGYVKQLEGTRDTLVSLKETLS